MLIQPYTIFHFSLVISVLPTTASMYASTHALEIQHVTLDKDISNALDDLKKNKLKLASSDTLIRQATMALKLGNDRYKLGVITTLELLTAQTNYQDALLARLQYE
ncbi:MAG TPA: hypothetical protein DCL77_20775, partial [Prolixibacteraceae bacterium]|nr:hypothetical protein [Prolixibacteraceae bacterium]